VGALGVHSAVPAAALMLLCSISAALVFVSASVRRLQRARAGKTASEGP
jgi:hypothetical protein